MALAWVAFCLRSFLNWDVVRLHCLGTAGFHPNDRRHTSCYFLPESGVLLDAGSGAFRLAPLIQTDEIDLLLSHAHLDHICGLTFLLDVFFQRPIQKLRIWGEKAKLDAIRKHLFSDLIFPVPLESQLDTQWIAIDDRDSFEAGGASVSWRPQEHPGGSVAYRLDWMAGQQSGQKQTSGQVGKEPCKSLVYITDTIGDVSDEGIDWAKDADLMTHECYFDDSMQKWAEKTGHSWTSRVTEVAIRAKPKKLLLTHINPLLGEPVFGASQKGAAFPHEGERDALPADFEAECQLIREKVAGEVVLAADEMEVDF